MKCVCAMTVTIPDPLFPVLKLILNRSAMYRSARIMDRISDAVLVGLPEPSVATLITRSYRISLHENDRGVLFPATTYSNDGSTSGRPHSHRRSLSEPARSVSSWLSPQAFQEYVVLLVFLRVTDGFASVSPPSKKPLTVAFSKSVESIEFTSSMTFERLVNSIIL